jgi:hypothetical protein
MIALSMEAISTVDLMLESDSLIVDGELGGFGLRRNTSTALCGWLILQHVNGRSSGDKRALCDLHTYTRLAASFKIQAHDK